MWWLLCALTIGCGFIGQESPPEVEATVGQDAEPELWPVSITQGSWFITAGTEQQLVVESPVTLLGPPIADTPYRQVVGAAHVVETWPALSRLEVDGLAPGLDLEAEFLARERLAEDAAKIEAFAGVAQAKSAGGSSPVVPNDMKSGVSSKLAPATTTVVPIDLKTGTDEERFDALGRYESVPEMTGAIVWVMENDASYEVRRKAWRVLRARWRRGTGNAADHEAAAVWLSSHGDKDLRTEAIAAIGSYSGSMGNAKRHLGDSDGDIRIRSASAVADVGSRTNRSDQARGILAGQVEKETDKKVAKHLGKLISEL